MCGHHQVIKRLSVTALTKLRSSEIQSKGFVKEKHNICWFTVSKVIRRSRRSGLFSLPQCFLFHFPCHLQSVNRSSLLKVWIKEKHTAKGKIYVMRTNSFLVILVCICLYASDLFHQHLPKVLVEAFDPQFCRFQDIPEYSQMFLMFFECCFFPPIMPRQFRCLNVMSSESAISCFTYLFNIFTYLHILKKFKRRS